MSSKMTNQDIIWQFEKAAAAQEIVGGSIFQVRAYQTAIETIENLDQELASLIKDGDLRDLPGIGKELSQKIIDLIQTGRSESLEKLFNQVPTTVFNLIKIPGIGPKKAFRLATALGLTSEQTAISELEGAAKAGKIRHLEGFGEKSEALILDNIYKTRPKSTRLRLDQAEDLVKPLLTLLKTLPQVKEVNLLGSLRRRQDTVGDLDIGIATNDSKAVIQAIKLARPDLTIKVEGENVIRCLLPRNIQADIKFQTPQKYGATLQHFTGSKAHNIALREFALKQGKSLSEHGIKQNGVVATYPDETSFYNALGLDYIPPELRENSGEIEAAATHTLPQLINRADILGDIHTHTNYPWKSSHDYGDSIENLLTKAHELRYQWLVLGDHNPSKKTYSQQQMVTEIKKRNRWIDQEYTAWKNKVKNSTLNIFKGMEIDIHPDGTLSVPDEGLNELDFVIVSIHSAFTLPKSLLTKRLLEAIKHPHISCIGHPTGRLVLTRTAMDIDWEIVFKACKTKRIAVEINADPHRLDLPDSLIRLAKNIGVMCVIGTDAHHSSSLQNITYGIENSRRGWLEAKDVLNTYSSANLKKWV